MPTPSQEAILFLAKAQPGRVTGVHQLCCARRDPDLERLRAALTAVAERHPVLRARVRWRDRDSPTVEVGNALPDPVVRRAPVTSPEALPGMLEAERARSLELAAPPVLHLLDVPFEDGHGVLVCTFHLALLDRRGAARVWSDVAAEYRRRGEEGGDADDQGGAPDGLAATHGSAPPSTGAEDHWRRFLGEVELPTPLPFAVETEGHRRRREALRRPLDPELPGRIDAFAAEVGCSRARVFEAAWSVLLRRLLGRRDVSFGTVGRPGQDDAVGRSETILPLAVDASLDGASMRELCRSLEEQARARATLGDPEPSGVHRALGLSPALRIHETVVAVEEEVWRTDASHGERGGPATELLWERSWTDDALRLVVEPGPPPHLRLELDPERVDPDAASTIPARFVQLLTRLLEDPEAPAVLRPYLSEEEAAALARARSGSEATEPGTSFLERLVARFDDRAGEVAILHGDRAISYAELDRASAALARTLRTVGVGPDVRVALVAERTPEVLVGLLAVLRAGGAYVPLDPAYPSDRLEYMLEDAEAALVLTPPGAAPPAPGASTPVAIPPLAELLAGGEGRDGGEEPSDDPIPDPAHLAYVIYTSGSTGRPKGVAMVHRALSNLVAWQLRASDAGVGDRTLQFASLSFDVSFQEIFATWCGGGTLVLVDEPVRRNPVALLDELERSSVARLFLPFIALQQLAEAAAHRGRVPTSLREVKVAGEQLRITAEIRSFFAASNGCSLENQYGPAETHVVTAHPLGSDPEGWPVLPAIGAPLPGVEALLLDPWRQPVPPGVVGEIHLGGVALARGYLDRPDLTEERFPPHPDDPDARVYRTGDLGRRSADGTLEFVGRVDHQVKIRGFRVEPGEVEDALERHPAVRSAVVVPGEDAGGSRVLLAWVVPEGREPDPAELRAFLAERLPPHMVPSRFSSVEAFPLTPSGKIDRRSLARRPTPERRDGPVTPSPSASRVEETVSRIWGEVLGLDRVPRDRSFFDLGGSSVLTLRTAVALSEALGREVPVMALFEHPTVARLAAELEGNASAAPARGTSTRRRSSEGPVPVAVVGMSCRLPGFPDVEAFWQGLLEGRDGIRHFTREELLEAGVAPEVLDDPDYVAARGMLEDADRFDADFFGYSPREARLMDPQHRLFLESCWQALESAGYAPDRVGMPVGVWGGMSTGMGYTTYLLSNLAAGGGVQAVDRLPVMLGNAYDYLTTRVSYKLNLQGPSVNVQTACSTSLVAVCQAVESLRRHECDMALAGGVSVSFPQRAGYLHQEGGIESSDGRCRPFDADAEGTVFSDGVATVVLRRLDDALRDGDPVHAVIHGVGINNDGADKVSFSAPSVAGQAAAVRAALDEAGFAPRTLGYVEAHGTATQLGDPIEVQALRRAFDTDERPDGPWCGLGSVKSNVGHTVAAAGAAALIKTVLGLREGTIPANLHFERPNEKLDLDGGPFFVAGARQPWPDTGGPRRAGVSSFGLGGTNAHVVLQEAPAEATRDPVPGRDHDLLVLSARDPDTLEEAREGMAAHLADANPATWWDAAHTTRVGRTPMEHRCAVVARDAEEAARILRGGTSPDLSTGTAPGEPSQVAFMFPGGGAQYPGMARDLLRREPVFEEAVRRCAELLPPELDLVGFLERDGAEGDEAREMERPGTALPMLFAVEYALARLWMSWGVEPAALIGHSMGEYTAACLAGVMSLEDAVTLVVARGRLFETLPEGAMTAVPLSEEALAPHLTPALSVAVVNGPDSTVASGPTEEVEGLERRLEAEEVECRRIHIAVAAHSTMVDRILDEFRAVFDGIELRPPSLPCISNVTGRWLTDEEAVSPDYWVRHLRSTVRFSQGLETLAGEGRFLLVEVGPGRTLASLAQLHPATPADLPVVASLRHPREEVDDERFLLRSLARLWTGGAPVGWPAFAGPGRRRVPVPPYPFRGPSFLVEPSVTPSDAASAAPSAAGAGPSPLLASLQEQIRMLTGGSTPPVAPVASAASRDPSPPVRSRAVPRRDRILSKLKDVVQELSGIAPDDLPADVSFLDMGFDSLFLTQASLGFKRAFGIRITFRQLFEEAPNLGALADYIDGELDDEVEVEAPAGSGLAATPADAPTGDAAPAAPLPAAGLQLPAAPAGGVDIHQILALQLQSTAALLQALSGGGAPSTQTAPQAAPPSGGPPAAGAAPATPSPAPEPPAEEDDSEAPAPSRASGPFRELNKERVSGLTEWQTAFLDDFMERYIARTRSSKELTQKHRDVFADPRAVAGFRKDWKEIVYPIAVDRSKGSRMWDVDGNEYVDAVSGFGAIFFGHAPDFVVEAVDDQLHHSLDYGPQSTIAGEIAEMVCKATGMERVSFCNTGSEAVLAAMRSARTATGMDTIVTFNGDYHGIFDEVLVRRQVLGKKTRNVPVAPGIPQSANDNMVVLDYGDPRSLDRIRELGDELAGVLVEPVQSRTPELQPREFLHGLRALCTEIGVPLIFDEIITGFRAHPRGAQGWFGVQADIAAYGKVVGGGMPIGIVAGKRLYVDSLDGGTWQYGDDSFPEAGVTYFAGTFIRHPLSLSAVRAVLRHLEEHDGDLQREVNHRTARLCVELNDWFEARGLPVHLVHFSSVFLPRFGGPPEFDPIFHRLLQYHGLHIWEGRPGFLTTAHTDADVDRMIEAFKRAADEMVEGGLLKPSGASSSDAEGETPAATPVEVPLTEPQTEIWLAAQMGDEGARAFNEPVRLDLRGPLHLPALRRAVRKVVERHEALRSTVRPDEPALRIHERMEVGLPVVDLRDEEPEERARLLQDHLLEESSGTFDLEHGPLIRFKLLRLEEELHALVVTVHHIACDGWSIEITLRDLAAFYDTAVTGRALELDEPMQLRAYNEHHRTRAESSEVEEMRRYWVDRFHPVPPVMELPTDRPRPPQKTYAGARRSLRVDPELGRRLKAMGAEHGCTLFTTLLAGFNVLMQKLTGETDVVVGVPAAGQALLGENALVAHCVSFLPIRSAVAPDQAFADHLRELRGIVMDANDNQEYTYGALVEELALPRDPSRVPLLAASFNLDPAMSGLEFHGLEWSYHPVPRSFSKLDIDLNIIETDGELLLEIDHNTDLLDEETALRWMDHYVRILEAAVEDPTRPVGALEVVSAEEQARLIAGESDPFAEPWEPARVEALVRERTAADPSATAVSFEGREVSYGDLDDRAERVAAGIRRAVDDPRDARVGVLLERSPEMIAVLLGILKAGAAYVPLDPDFPEARLRLIVEDAGLAAVVVDGRGGEIVGDAAPVLELARLLEAEPDGEAVPVEDPEALAYVLYTSGSTGRPKGVEVPHRAVANFLRSMAATPGIGPEDRLLAVTTISFDISVLELFLPLSVGGTVILAAQEVAQDGVALAELMERTGPTIMQATPTHWQLLRDAGWSGREGLKVLAGGEALPPELARALAASCGEVWNMYGPTETTIWSTCARIRPEDGTVSIGRPIAATRAYVLDDELRPVAPGVPGQLWLGGAGVTRGYRNRPDLTAERFVEHPHDPAAGRLYGTGDVVRYRPDGTLEFVGRADRQVKVRGFRVELGDVESALASHPAVDRAVASVRDLGSGDVRLLAHYLGEGPVDDAELRSHLRATLPEYMVPQALVWLEGFPRTANGKVDVRALPVPFATGDDGASAEEPTEWQDELEAQVAEVWREVLGVARVGRLEDFFDLGGHSVLATRVMSRLRTRHDLGLGLRDLFRHPTVAELAERIRSLRGNGAGDEATADRETEEFVI